MTTIIIADDEPLLRFHLQKTLAEVWPEADVIAQAANGEEAWSLINELKPDVAFLDIHMPGLTGLEVALQIAKTELACQVVFLTAYDQYAVQAFERGAVDYLLKPLDENRMQQTVQRLIAREPAQPKTEVANIDLLLEMVNATGSQRHLTWLNAQQGESVKVIHVDDVLFFLAQDKYTTLVTETGEYLLRQSIKQLEEQLNADLFWRIHRSTLVNIRFVDRVEKNLQGQCSIKLKNYSKPLAVSRAKQHLFKAH